MTVFAEVLSTFETNSAIAERCAFGGAGNDADVLRHEQILVFVDKIHVCGCDRNVFWTVRMQQLPTYPMANERHWITAGAYLTR
jgi:hypothetical protein